MIWHAERSPEGRAGLDRNLLDAARDAHDAWLTECGRVRGAYSHWSRAGSGDGALCFAAYISALDSEQQAAEVFRQAYTKVHRTG